MKTSEMIAMLEKNPKFILESEKVNFVDDDLIVKMSGENVVFFYDKEGKTVSKAIGLDLRRDWQLVRTPVPWQEAIQAWAEGKTVRCDFPKNPASYIFNEFHARSREIDTLNTPLSRDMITSGIWYIEDGEADD